MPDYPFDLDRFLAAQAPVFATALGELQLGRKRSHWMWFVFPQLRGLGHSSMAQFYGLASLEEARAYLAHPILGPRLLATTEAVMNCKASTLREVFGAPDDLKFCSSMTLFALASPGRLFDEALARWCDGEKDPGTLALLGRSLP